MLRVMALDKLSGIPYIGRMIEIRRTEEFERWFSKLRDRRAVAKIQTRLDRVEDGNLGDFKRFSGLLELRINEGPGYRVYCVERGKILIVVLAGGTKASQEWDIKRALKLAQIL